MIYTPLAYHHKHLYISFTLHGVVCQMNYCISIFLCLLLLPQLPRGLCLHLSIFYNFLGVPKGIHPTFSTATGFLTKCSSSPIITCHQTISIFKICLFSSLVMAHLFFISSFIIHPSHHIPAVEPDILWSNFPC